MKLDIKRKKEYITCGDLAYSELLNEHGFIGRINKNYYFIDNNYFENLSEPFEDLDELVDKLKIELVAKNKNLRMSLNEGQCI